MIQQADCGTIRSMEERLSGTTGEPITTPSKLDLAIMVGHAPSLVQV
jgi:hypothetical protein